MQSQAATVDAYLAELPPERRAAIAAVRATIVAQPAWPPAPLTRPALASIASKEPRQEPS